ncbi:hypothetical protein L6164_023829 [Bauhinia variegata]|uniref:Uncharacterized protein n=1 Tax=Bauhinia variegata TaxID=167791 RepID=A0ACB9MJT6_BAUVA|nr:hypothetical protein L6164_023829 [Bauhinia variegata]
MKQVVGTVVSNKMQKSVVVTVDRLFPQKLYNRYVKRTSKFIAHDEKNHCVIGDPRKTSCLLYVVSGMVTSDWAYGLLGSCQSL